MTSSDPHDERSVRLQKLQALRTLGVKLYPDRFSGKQDIDSIRSQSANKDFRTIDDIISGPTNEIHTAGRIMLVRSFGKLIFGTLQDYSGQIQFALSKDFCLLSQDGGEITEIGKEPVSAFKIFEKYIDRGDIIGIHGELFMTHKGELTVFVRSFQLLSKAFLPLPEKFHGLADEETIYRKRYLDMITEKSSYDRMVFRSRFVQKLREFYYREGFIEVETPTLGNSASGALAHPFTTHHEATDSDLYLRIAPETSLKKCTVGGMEKVFEIGKSFRNEGLDPSHLPEFTSVEHYAVYWNYEDNMDFTERMFGYILDELMNGNKKVEIINSKGEKHVVDFRGKWPRRSICDLIQEHSDINIYEENTLEKLQKAIQKAGIQIDGMMKLSHGTLIDKLYKKVARPHIINPTFVIHQPLVLSPLARLNDTNPSIVDRFQLCINGWEVTNAYSELIDPVDQDERFKNQVDAKKAGDDEVAMPDDDFVAAMEHGMPPQSGFGMGVDRIVALLTAQPNLRDVVLFPLVKDKNPKIISSGVASSESVLLNKILPQLAGKEKNDPHGHINIDLPIIEATLAKYSTTTKDHNLTVGRCMRYFGQKLGKNADYWYAVGVLHDVDWDVVEKDAERHCGESLAQILAEMNAPVGMLEDIRSHYEEKFPEHGFDTDLRKYLASVDELSGFIWACSRMTPNKSLDEVKVTSVLKKLKDKGFAAGVSREHCRRCETLLSISLEDFIPQMIEGMKNV
ncbi:lysine--tRNA ligase [Candidatus Gracilibacteria bacterium]|nr:lysine--tRNA ligase [Candidatus Gracilibacteria bacterium]